METFEFKARKKNGELVSGKLIAANEAAVVSHIREQGFYATKVRKVQARHKGFSLPFLEERVTLYDLSVFCRQFATLIAAGVPLITSLEIMGEQTTKKYFRGVIVEIDDTVRKGSPFSVALNDYPKIFPQLMVRMVEAGEAGGILEEVLYRLAEKYEKDYRMNSRLKSAMVYPGVVICAALLSVTIILTFVMPTFIGLFQQLNVELPLPTRVVIGLSNFLQNYWWLLLLAIGGLAFAWKEAKKRPDFCFWLDGILLRAPVLGPLYNKVIITRFASTFASLSRSGVPILAGLTIVSKATGSVQAEKIFDSARMNVQRGESFAEPMKESKLFPPLVVSMVSIGEETGNLEYMLERISDFYSAEVDDMLGRMQALLDPILIVILGVMVGFIAVAMLLPMFDMITKVGNV